MSNITTDSVKSFDNLYADFCNNLREAGKASEFCERIKYANSDLKRVQILLKEYKEVIPDFITSAKENKGKNCKNTSTATEIFEIYKLSKSSLDESHENLLDLLNSALAHVPIENELEIDMFTDDKIYESSLVEQLLTTGENKKKLGDSAEEKLLTEIYTERCNYYFYVKDYEFSLLSGLRALHNLPTGSQNQDQQLFPLLYKIGGCYKELGHCEDAMKVVQLSIKLLRESTLDNTVKSIETVGFVKLMKEIHQQSSTPNKKKSDKTSEFETIISQSLNSKQQERNSKHLKVLPSLFEGPNDILVGASSAIQLKWEQYRGRHVTAKKAIPPGATVIVESPYVWVVHPKDILKYCQNCCGDAKDFFPCKMCTSVVYCSKKCREDSFFSHKFECQVFSCITSSETLGDMALLCYRTITSTNIKTLLDHIREYSSLQSKTTTEEQVNPNNAAVNTEEEKISQVKFILGLDTDGKLNSSNYTSVFAQTTNSENRLSGDMFKRCFSAIYLAVCLRFVDYVTNAGQKNKKNEKNAQNPTFSQDEELIASLFLRHLQSASCNAYGINIVKGSDPRRFKIQEIGGATFPLISTTNHSCNSNVYRYTVGKTCVVKALREIQAGEEILDSYGPTFASTVKEERMRYLQGQYLFSCQCSPCLEDWAVYNTLPKENICYKCQRCRNDNVNLGGSTIGKEKRKCFKCSATIDTKKIMKAVKQSERQFLAAKDMLLNSKDDDKKRQLNYSTIQSSISQYINMLGRIQNWPCQALVECQEALKLCCNLENRT